MNPALYVTWKYGDINVLSATRMIPWKKKKRHNPLLQLFITLLSDNENNIDKNQLKEPLDNTLTKVLKRLTL